MRIKSDYNSRSKESTRKWKARRSRALISANHIGLLLGFLAIVTIAGGAWLQYGRNLSAKQLLIDLWANAGTELISIAITVLIIDALNRRRAYEEEAHQEVRNAQERLLADIWNSDPKIVSRALGIIVLNEWYDLLVGERLQSIDLSKQNLRNMNLDGAWLEKAILRGANLRGATLNEARLRSADLQEAFLVGAQLAGANMPSAQLQNADLHSANLVGADIRHANLEGANLTHTNLYGADLLDANLKGAQLELCELVYCCSLRGATMPDGTKYDGRFRLEGDIKWAEAGWNGIDTNDDEQMATQWYEVTVEQYRAGQAWFARKKDKLQNEWEAQHGSKKNFKSSCGPSPAIKKQIKEGHGHVATRRAEPVRMPDKLPPPVDTNQVV